MKDGRHSAWYTYEHTEVRDPQGTNGTDGDYFTHRSARGSVRGWRSYTVSQVNSEAHGPQENGGTFLAISPRTVATTDKTVLQGKGASHSCSNINFSLKPPVSQWQGDENNYTTQEMEYPYEEDEYTYSVLREDEGDTYDNNSSPYAPECLRQEVSQYDIDNSNCLAEDVLLGKGLSPSSEFRDNENNGTGHTSPFLSGTKGEAPLKFFFRFHFFSSCSEENKHIIVLNCFVPHRPINMHNETLITNNLYFVCV